MLRFSLYSILRTVYFARNGHHRAATTALASSATPFSTIHGFLPSGLPADELLHHFRDIYAAGPSLSFSNIFIQPAHTAHMHARTTLGTCFLRADFLLKNKMPPARGHMNYITKCEEPRTTKSITSAPILSKSISRLRPRDRLNGGIHSRHHQMAPPSISTNSRAPAHTRSIAVHSMRR